MFSSDVPKSLAAIHLKETEVVCLLFWQLGRRWWKLQRKLHELAEQNVTFLFPIKK